MPDPTELHDPERFWRYVEPFAALDACWMWTGPKDRDGYGRFRPRIGPRRLDYVAHRLAFYLLRGPIPDGLTIDHLCLNKACVNPDHLEPVTNAENIQRSRAQRGFGGVPVRHRQRGPRKIKTHCKHGHEFNDENTYVSPEGRRACRACGRIRHRLSYRAAVGK